MKKINKYIQINWYKIGYKNYDYYLARKHVCYSGKKILFSWNKEHFQNVLIMFTPYIYPRENKSFNDYLKEII